MKNSSMSGFNFRIDPPKIGTASILWRTGIFSSLGGIIMILMAGLPVIILSIFVGSFDWEVPAYIKWWVKFGCGFMAGGMATALVAYFASRLHPQKKYQIINEKRIWLVATILGIVFAPFIMIFKDSSEFLTVPPILGVVLFMIMEITDYVEHLKNKNSR